LTEKSILIRIFVFKNVSEAFAGRLLKGEFEAGVKAGQGPADDQVEGKAVVLYGL
jgi:hypothetical protein